MLHHRIFLASHFTVDEHISLSPQAVRHVQVLRLQPGLLIELFDGAGNVCTARIDHMGKHRVDVTVIALQTPDTTTQTVRHIVVGMPANERMDWLVEKATELGATRITPVMTQRTVLRLSGDRADKRLEHWQGIAQASCSQSGRNHLPQIDLPMNLTQYLNDVAHSSPHLKVVLSLQAGTRHWRELWHNPVSHVTLLSGPEGGLSPQEEQAAQNKGFIPASLGAQVLRAETASLAVLAQLL